MTCDLDLGSQAQIDRRSTFQRKRGARVSDPCFRQSNMSEHFWFCTILRTSHKIFFLWLWSHFSRNVHFTCIIFASIVAIWSIRCRYSDVSQTLIFLNSHTHTLSLSLSLTHTHKHRHTLSLTHTHCYTNSLTLFLSLSLSLSDTPTHTHTLSYTPTHTHSLIHTLKHKLSLSHTNRKREKETRRHTSRYLHHVRRAKQALQINDENSLFLSLSCLSFWFLSIKILHFLS